MLTKHTQHAHTHQHMHTSVSACSKDFKALFQQPVTDDVAPLYSHYVT